MKFKDIKLGEWCVFADTPPSERYFKINPVEDKWGDCYVAVANNGYLVDSMFLKDNTEVVKCENV